MLFRRPLYEGVDWNKILCKLSLRGCAVALFTRAWIEIIRFPVCRYKMRGRPLYEGVDWNSGGEPLFSGFVASPSLRGRGLKYLQHEYSYSSQYVALFTRAWIEMTFFLTIRFAMPVALFTRAWIEIKTTSWNSLFVARRPLYEGVDWNIFPAKPASVFKSRPLYEGVDWNFGTGKSQFMIVMSPSLRGRGLKLLSLQ